MRARIDAIQRLSLDLAAAQGIDQVAVVIVDNVVASTGAAGAALWLITDGGLAAAAAAGTLAGVDLPAPDAAALHSSDVRAARPWLTSELAAALRSHGAARTRAVTLHAGELAVGALALSFADARPADSGHDDAGLLGAIVRPSADAIARARGIAHAQQLDAIVESTDDAIVAATPDQTIFAWNPGAERLFEHPRAEAVGGNLSMLVGVGDEDAPFAAVISRLRSGGAAERTQGMRMRSDGTARTLAMTISPMRDRTQTLVGVTIAARDVTESAHLADELKRAQRLEALGRLAGGVAHDFNNLLAVIVGCLDLLQLMPLTSDQAELVGEALAASTSAKELTGQLLAFARAQPVAPVPLSLEEETRAMMPMLGRLLGHSVQLAIGVDDSTPLVLADPGQLKQIIMNLVLNARDAMPEGGRITVQISPGASADTARMTVSDDGHGIEPEVLARLFEPFFTTKEAGQGTGLGLATVHGAVTQAGGTIMVRSEPGAGAQFTVELPAAPDRRVSTEGSQMSPQRKRGGKTILVCDDDHAVLSVTTRILEHAGYQVVATSDPGQAETIGSSDPSIAALITDVRMPSMTGPELAQRITAKCPGMPVLFVSGHAPGHLDAGDRAGPSGVLAKPFSSQSLLSALRPLLVKGATRDRS